MNVQSFRKKSQTWIPKEFETFHFTSAAVDVLNQIRRFKLNYYYLFKKKMKRIKDNPNFYASIRNIT